LSTVVTCFVRFLFTKWVWNLLRLFYCPLCWPYFVTAPFDIQPITVPARPKAWTFLARTLGFCVRIPACLCLFCVCVR
jgi:hypothetical protein